MLPTFYSGVSDVPFDVMDGMQPSQKGLPPQNTNGPFAGNTCGKSIMHCKREAGYLS